MVSEKHVATLVRGDRYCLAGANAGADLTFEKGTGVIVSEVIRDHLATTVGAIDDIIGERDDITGSIEVISRQKFNFEPYEGPLNIGEVASTLDKPARPRTVQATPLPKSRTRKKV